MALVRLGRTGRRFGELDPILGVVNIASAVIVFAFLFYAARQAG